MDLSPLPSIPAAPCRHTKPPLVSKLQQKKLIPFGWYGGKFSHLDWLLPLLPEAYYRRQASLVLRHSAESDE